MFSLEVVGEVHHFGLKADQAIDLQVLKDLVLSVIPSLYVELLFQSIKFQVELHKIILNVFDLDLPLGLLRRHIWLSLCRTTCLRGRLSLSTS